MTHILSHNLEVCDSIFGCAKLTLSKPFFSTQLKIPQEDLLILMVNVNVSTRGNKFRISFEGGEKVRAKLVPLVRPGGNFRKSGLYV